MATGLDLTQVSNYATNINNSINSLDDSVTGTYDAKNLVLAQKQLRQKEQEAEIAEKTQLVLTRARMLQLAEERNMYKKKIIYTLLAVILLILIITLTTYVFFSKQSKTSNK